MDDEVMGPGGSLALHAQLGSSVRVVFCAAGANAAEDHVRRGETQTVKQYLGLAQIEFLGFPEGRLSLHEKQLSQALTSSIQEFSPDQVFCPYFADHHRDHSAATLALCASLEQTAWRGEVWSYEVWSPLWPNVAVDISSVADTKREAIELYASQVQGLHYPEGILGLNRYRGLRVYANYAEAFFVASAAEFIPLAREMNQL